MNPTVSLIWTITWNLQLQWMWISTKHWIFPGEKQDLLECLQNLAENIDVRFPELLTESFNFVQLLFKADVKQFDSIALKMAELQADNKARVRFDVFNYLGKLWITSIQL